MLSVRNLSASFHTRAGIVRAVRNVSFDVAPGETLGIVGESGSGKSVTCYSMMGLIPMPPGRIESGSAMLDGTDLLRCPEKELRAIRGNCFFKIFQDPMTSCGCFDCICGIEPGSNGFIVANREYKGMTPVGMTFGELASCTGGGVQTPGDMGHGRHFISSKMFIAAEGGIERIVWMPKELKDDVAERLNRTAKELYGIDNFSDMIADETICEDCEALMDFLTEKNHPVLGLEPLM